MAGQEFMAVLVFFVGVFIELSISDKYIVNNLMNAMMPNNAANAQKQ